MSDKMRWKYGETNPVVSAVDSASVIETGDLVWQGGSLEGDMQPKVAWPASTIAHAARQTLANKQRSFAAAFLGVAMQRSCSGNTNPVRVATTGVFEFDCPSGTFELGDLMGVAETSSGTALENQKVASVSASIYAVGRVAKQSIYGPDPATAVLIDIRSTVMTGGVVDTNRTEATQ